jgi:hypothetical protein
VTCGEWPVTSWRKSERVMGARKRAEDSFQCSVFSRKAFVRHKLAAASGDV